MRLSTALTSPAKVWPGSATASAVDRHADGDRRGVALGHPEVDEDLGGVLDRRHHRLRVDEVAGRDLQQADGAGDRASMIERLSSASCGVAQLELGVVGGELGGVELHVGDGVGVGELGRRGRAPPRRPRTTSWARSKAICSDSASSSAITVPASTAVAGLDLERGQRAACGRGERHRAGGAAFADRHQLVVDDGRGDGGGDNDRRLRDRDRAGSRDIRRGLAHPRWGCRQSQWSRLRLMGQAAAQCHSGREARAAPGKNQAHRVDRDHDDDDGDEQLAPPGRASRLCRASLRVSVALGRSCGASWSTRLS